MQTVPVQTAFGVITDFLVSRPTPQEIVLYELPRESRHRYSELIKRNDAGQLTIEEQEELSNYRWADKFMISLKLKTWLCHFKDSELLRAKGCF